MPVIKSPKLKFGFVFIRKVCECFT